MAAAYALPTALNSPLRMAANDPQGGIVCLIRLDEFQQLLADWLGIWWKGYPQRQGIPFHAGPVPFEGKQHAIDDANGAEETPIRCTASF